MKKTPLLIVSHVAAVLLGLLLFRSVSPGEPSPQNTPATATAQPVTQNAAATESTASSNKTKPRTAQASKASVHLSAWKALASEGLTRPERMKASHLLLQEWIKEDWRSALDMVMKETPDDFELLDDFHLAFSREPEAVWQLIEQKRYGVLSQSLVSHWQSALEKCDEATIRKVAAALPERGKEAALATLSWK